MHLPPGPPLPDHHQTPAARDPHYAGDGRGPSFRVPRQRRAGAHEFLITDPRHALITAARVGEAPVGLALVKHGTRIVVADSNRFNLRGNSASLAVVDVADALAHRPALAGYLRAGRFPREMAVVPGGRTLIVTNYDSAQLESVNLSELP